MKRSILAVGALTLLLAACGGGDDEGERATATGEATATQAAEPDLLELTDAEHKYLDELEAFMSVIFDTLDDQSEALSRLWNTRGVWLNQLETFDVQAAVLAAGDLAQEVEPPERFEEEHAALLLWFEASSDAGPAYYQAVEAEDFVAIFVHGAEIESAFFVLLLEGEPVFCEAIIPDNAPARLCPDPHAGLGDYAFEMRNATQAFHAEADPRISAFPRR